MGAGGILGDLEREKKMRRCGGELVSLRGSHLTPPINHWLLLGRRLQLLHRATFTEMRKALLLGGRMCFCYDVTAATPMTSLFHHHQSQPNYFLGVSEHILDP